MSNDIYVEYHDAVIRNSEIIFNYGYKTALYVSG